MKFQLPFVNRMAGLFNLNDPKWGRDDDKPASGSADNGRSEPPKGNKPGPNQGPPDLDELWRDLNRKLGNVFGANKGGGKGKGGGSGGGGFQPDMNGATGLGIGLILSVVVLIWLGTGMFNVQEGEEAVITRFGKFNRIEGAGFKWRLPYPIERHEKVYVTRILSVDVGSDTIIKATGLRESAMLTQDENIVEIKFAVQYRLNDARAYLFESKDPRTAVIKAAETAVREVVGGMTMDAALSEKSDAIAPDVRRLMQTILDRYNVGVEVVAINLQQGGVRPPEQVQEAFDDVLKAGQERERAKNEAEAYANNVIPRAKGSASRLKQEADAYKATIVAQAEGDAQRFKSVLAQYQKAPQVTRDRMYLDAMQQIYSRVTKIVVDSKQGSNLLYLPLDKILQMTGQTANGASASPSGNSAGAISDAAAASTGVPASVAGSNDSRSRDAARSRDRELR